MEQRRQEHTASPDPVRVCFKFSVNRNRTGTPWSASNFELKAPKRRGNVPPLCGKLWIQSGPLGSFWCYKLKVNYRVFFMHKVTGKPTNFAYPFPDIAMAGFGTEPYNEQQPSYVPPELVNFSSNTSKTTYHCYLIELNQNCRYDVHDIVLAMRSKLDSEIVDAQFEICDEKGNLTVKLRYAETTHLDPTEVQRCRIFQSKLFSILLSRNWNNSARVSDESCLGDSFVIDYLLLPATALHQRPSNSIIDWKSVGSASFSSEDIFECKDHAHRVQTENGLVCSCKLENSLVITPHNDIIYIISGAKILDGNSLLYQGKGKATTYNEYFEKSHGKKLQYVHQKLLKGRPVFKVKNYLLGCRQTKTKETGNFSVELPPELCSIIMSPISISTIYSFSRIPSIMHRLESLLLAFNLKKMLRDHCTQNDIPIVKVLEAITTAECQESFDYESLETLGDSFLKYAASQQLFKTYQNESEGFLTEERKKLISNVALCKLGSRKRLPGFIQNRRFDPKTWIIPGDTSRILSLKEDLVPSRTKVYVCGKRKLKSEIVADVVEALIGAFLSTGGEEAALLFMNWIGLKMDFNNIPYKRHLSIKAEEFVDVSFLKSCLNNYSFHDSSLLVEALTHGSYKNKLPICYQRLEFLGDAVLDYLITMHFYKEYPKIPPGLLTDMRSASVNKECYALSAIRATLHNHILRDSQDIDKQIANTIKEVEKLSSETTYGWQLDTSFPPVLEDVIESLAGAILVDSGYNKNDVFRSIRPLLKTLVTPETVSLHPFRELIELCDKEKYTKPEPVVSRENGVTSVTIEVKAKGIKHKHTEMAANQESAKKLASKQLLKSLKEAFSKN